MSPCPHCGKPINPAALLGARSKGKPKTLTPEARATKAASLAAARQNRWKQSSFTPYETP
jgi:hypothetical protein